MTSSDAWDVVVLGSGIAGLAGALAAHELGLRPIVLEKASTLGGGTVNSYGLIWVGQNHLAQAAGYSDTRDETIAYMRFLGGGSLDDDRMSTFVDRSPEALRNFLKSAASVFTSSAASPTIITASLRARTRSGDLWRSTSSRDSISATGAIVSQRPMTSPAS
jgi:glycine/D-amino acid oxidase-like deaminating enzyme